MAESSFRSRLSKLFSTKVIVRRTGKTKLKVYDTSKLQSVGTRDSAYRGRYTGVHTYKSHGYYTPNSSTNFFATKLELYRDYEAMDEDPILASALDIYADESTMRSPDGTILNIKSQNDKVKQILHNLFYDILNIEFNLWSWVRNACKYGDFYLALDLDEELGVVNVIPMSSYDVQRMEGMEIYQNGMQPSMDATYPEGGIAGYNPYDVKFKYEPLTNRNPFLKDEYEYYEVAHFRLLSDTNFLPYGRSMLEPARKEFKRLALMEDAMMIHRVMRAPQRRVYKISVGNLSPNEIDQYMKKIMDDTKKIPYIDEKTGQYNLKFNLENMLEDIYIPVRGGDSQTEIETLDGLDNSGFIEDVDYIKQKMMAALKIPKAFLGYDENLEGKAVLAAEDVRFARTIERIQSIFESELYKIAVIHLFLQGYSDASLIDFELSLNNPSIVYERQRVEVMTEKVNLATAMKESKLVSRKYIFENVLNMSRDEWTDEEDLIMRDQATQWRMDQIANEGNDPRESGEAKGTPHAIAQMHVSKTPEEDDGGEYGKQGGRPKSLTKFGTDRDKSNGRDPLGFQRTMSDTGFSAKAESAETKKLLSQLKDSFGNGNLNDILKS
jgi:hypothetical protein